MVAVPEGQSDPAVTEADLAGEVVEGEVASTSETEASKTTAVSPEKAASPAPEDKPAAKSMSAFCLLIAFIHNGATLLA